MALRCDNEILCIICVHAELLVADAVVLQCRKTRMKNKLEFAFAHTDTNKHTVRRSESEKSRKKAKANESKRDHKLLNNIYDN